MASNDPLRVTTDRSALDVDMIHRFLAASYWAKDIPREVVVKSLDNSLCFGLFLGREQIGFARMVTDYATFAYLADVFVLEEHRGHGYGKRLIREILCHEDVVCLRRVLLATKDAQELYRPFGFQALGNAAEYMTIHRPNIYAADRL